MSRQPRSGFTLIEVLIALGLSVMLISSVYAAIDLYYRYHNAGRAEIRGQQLVRSLSRRVAQDLASVVLQLPAAAAIAGTGQAAATGSTATGSTSTSSTSTGAMATGSSAMGSSATGSSTSTTGAAAGPSSGSSSFADAAQGGTNPAQAGSGTASSFLGLTAGGLPVVFGVCGTAEILHVSVSQPSRDLSYRSAAEQAAPTDRSSDLQLVTYGLAPIDAANMALLQKSLQTTRPAVGFGRRTRDLYSPLETTEELEPHNLLAPEVTEVGFRYFDGSSWLESWDSSVSGQLPRAIEVNFGFWNPPPVQVGRVRNLDPGKVTYVQNTFLLPMSAPPTTTP